MRLKRLVFGIIDVFTVAHHVKWWDFLWKGGALVSINMRTISSRELIKILEENGWVKVRTSGDDCVFKHPNIKKVISMGHPRKTVNPLTAVRIFKDMGINRKQYT
jgi:predicted RNA binding protein YcfA (HicA-like mRNA interferase family)